jgi:Fe-S-cluster-containing hydrogenase component 2
MDGVFIGGCRLNECNYITHGNFHALNMVHLCKNIMSHVGLDPNRLNIEFMSAGEGILFTEVVDNFTKKIRELGPLGSSEGIDSQQIRAKLQEIERLVPYVKIAKRDKLALRLNTEEDYKGLYSREEIDTLFSEVASYHIDPAKCQACMTCLRRCPVEAISGGKNLIHVIDQDKCIKCGTCFEVCPPRFGAVQTIVGQAVPPSIPEDQRVLARKGKGAEKPA